MSVIGDPSMSHVEVTPEYLISMARKALSSAYAPYSGICVGAAVSLEDGRIVTGVNVENASYGLTICAERAAIFTAVGQGSTRILALALTSNRLQPITPCGACRQVLAEFSIPSTQIILDMGSGKAPDVHTLGDLLPLAFGLQQEK